MYLNILMTIAVAYIMVLPFLLFNMVCYRFSGTKPVVKPKKNKKPAGISPEERKIFDIMANIEAYDGTSNGQRPIKE